MNIESSHFESLGLIPALANGAAGAGWITATPIQVEAIPAVLAGRDLLALAPTGSGKTAAFLLPLLQRLLADGAAIDARPRPVRALVLAPTRELASQIDAAARGLAPALKTVLLVGGVSVNPQMMALRGGAHLVVATPGRLLDLVERNALPLATLQLLVLDEADRLLDLGFADEIGRVLQRLPAHRQTLMLSATMPDAVAALAEAALRDPHRLDLRTAPDAEAPAIAQRALVVDSARRTPLLQHLLRRDGWSRVLVFVASQYASEHVADKLRQAGIPAAALHGRLSQGRRRQVLADLGSGALQVLVATDLAARGLHIDGLAVVVNHDLPRAALDYTHRIGRTGRAGERGQAISFVCPDVAGQEAHFRLIEKRQGQPVAREQVAGFEPVAPTATADTGGGIKGRRPSKKDKQRAAAAAASNRRR